MPNTHRFDTGAATDADAAPAYRVYEQSTTTPLLTGTMALLDSTNTAGFYQAQITLSPANGFEDGKSYGIYISAAVNAITGTMHHQFRVGPGQANVTQWLGTAAATPTVAGVPEVDITHLVGVAQSAADLKDFADDGYDPATNKVQGLVLADAVTTLNGLAANVITATSIANGAFTAAKFAAGAFLAVWDTLDSAIVVANSIGMRLKTNIDALISSRSTYAGADTAGTTTLLARIIGTLAAGTHQPQSGDAYTRIGAGGVALTTIPWNATWDAEVQSEVQDALEANNLDHLVGTDIGIPVLPPGTYLEQMATVDQLADELTGPLVTVVDGAGGNTALTFKIDLGGMVTDAPKDAWLSFTRTTTTVALRNQVKRVVSFNTTTDFITLASAYTTTPAIGDTARLVTK